MRAGRGQSGRAGPGWAGSRVKGRAAGARESGVGPCGIQGRAGWENFNNAVEPEFCLILAVCKIKQGCMSEAADVIRGLIMQREQLWSTCKIRSARAVNSILCNRSYTVCSG